MANRFFNWQDWQAMTCPDCEGKGSCPFCSSTGKVYVRKERKEPIPGAKPDCPDCRGNGWVYRGYGWMYGPCMLCFPLQGEE